MYIHVCSMGIRSRTSVITYARSTLAGQAADIVRLAEVEGLAGHGRAVRIRLESPEEPEEPQERDHCDGLAR